MKLLTNRKYEELKASIYKQGYIDGYQQGYQRGLHEGLITDKKGVYLNQNGLYWLGHANQFWSV